MINIKQSQQQIKLSVQCCCQKSIPYPLNLIYTLKYTKKLDEQILHIYIYTLMII